MEKSKLALLTLSLLFSVVSSRLSVIHPSSLKAKTTNGIIPASLGNFGHISYGTSIVSIFHNYNIIRWEEFIILMRTKMDVKHSQRIIL
jgi:hypothetical protein